MSFLGALKKVVGIAEKVEHYALPVAGMFYPPAIPYLAKIDDAVQHLHGSVIATEINNPTDGQGAVKSVAVNADLDSYIDTMNAGLAFVKKKVEDDKDLRKAAIDATVAAYNADAKWRTSFKVVDIP